MRTVLLATTLSFALLTACGSGKQSQANDAQANISTGNRVPGAGSAGPVDVKQAMHERHESMEKIGKASKSVRRELGGDKPNLGTIRDAAATIDNEAKRTGSLFPQGSGEEAGKTGAKAEIWSNPQDFSAKVTGFQQAAAAFHQAAAGNDVAAIKKSFADLGNSCKACHDKYRAEEKH